MQNLGGQTECIMSNWKIYIENEEVAPGTGRGEAAILILIFLWE